MNWSTRLRRWVRISTPPVRDASTNPTAATVLPAPVACSNQKRRLAPGSSGASSITSSPRPRLSSQSCGSSSGASTSSSSSSTGSPFPFAGSPLASRLAAVAAPVAPRRAAGALELGGDRRERSRQGIHLVLVELGAVAQHRPSRPRAGARARAAASSRVATRTRDARCPRRARRGRSRRLGAAPCRAPGRRSSRPRAGSAHGRTPALDRGRPRSARSPPARQRQWYWPWERR